jgi:hypothetical protein
MPDILVAPERNIMPMVKGATAYVFWAAMGEVFYKYCAVAMNEAGTCSPFKYFEAEILRAKRYPQFI